MEARGNVKEGQFWRVLGAQTFSIVIYSDHADLGVQSGDPLTVEAPPQECGGLGFVI